MHESSTYKMHFYPEKKIPEMSAFSNFLFLSGFIYYRTGGAGEGAVQECPLEHFRSFRALTTRLALSTKVILNEC